MSKKAQVKKDVKSEKELAQAKISAIEKKETEDCAKKVNDVLNEFGCIAVVSGQFINDKIETKIAIVKKK